jgi:hypothetical protein
MTAPDNRYTPSAESFRAHTWETYAGWTYALHPMDKVDDPYRRRVTVKAPDGEDFVDWIPVGDTPRYRREAIEQMGAEAVELADVAFAIARALAWIDKRENPQPPCRFLLQRLPLGFAHGKQGGLF